MVNLTSDSGQRILSISTQLRFDLVERDDWTWKGESHPGWFDKMTVRTYWPDLHMLLGSIQHSLSGECRTGHDSSFPFITSSVYESGCPRDDDFSQPQMWWERNKAAAIVKRQLRLFLTQSRKHEPYTTHGSHSWIICFSRRSRTQLNIYLPYILRCIAKSNSFISKTTDWLSEDVGASPALVSWSFCASLWFLSRHQSG